MDIHRNVPLAMNIEQGIRTGGTTLVGTITARDVLSALWQVTLHTLLMQVMANGHYIYILVVHGWRPNQDSATVDAKTLTTTSTMPRRLW